MSATGATAPTEPGATQSRSFQQPAQVSVLPVELLPPLDDIRDRSTSEYRAFFDCLMADLKEHGVRVPLIAFRDGNKPRVIDGETRRQGLLLGGMYNPVPVLLYGEKPDESALKIGQLQANALRLGMTDLEYAAVYQQLMKLNGWSPAELFRTIKVNPSTGSKRLAISTRLCDQAKAWVADGSLAARPAYALSRLEAIPLQLEVAKKYRKGVLCAEGVEEEVARLLSGGKRVKKVKPLKLKLDAIEIITKRDTPLETLAATLDKVSVVVRKLLKEHKGPEYLQLELKSA